MSVSDTPVTGRLSRYGEWFRRRTTPLTLLSLLLLTLAVYSNSFDNRFVNWDDDLYITRNPLVRDLSPAGIVRIFSRFHFTDYLPLSLLSIALDYRFWGLDPIGYHLTTTFLHGLNGIFLFLLIRRLAGNYGIALLTSLIFLVHPVQVESVVWLTERKNVLSMAFLLAAVLTHIRSRGPDAPRYSLGLSWFLYLLSILSKSAVVGAPLIFIALDRWWGDLSWREIARRNAPYFLIAALSAALTLASQSAADAVKTYRGDSFLLTMRLMMTVLWDYVRTLAVPLHLNNFYQYDAIPALGDRRFWFGGALVGLFIVTALRQPLGRPVSAFCILWFSVFLLPVFNVVPIAIVRADRYMYFPSIGLFWLLSLALDRAWSRAGGRAKSVAPRFLLVVGMTGILLFWGRLTLRRNEVWQDSATLWTDHLRDYPQSITGYFNLAGHYLTRGEYEKARPLYEKLLLLQPAHMRANYNLARIDEAEGRLDEAIAHFERAVQLAPGEKIIYKSLGLACYKAGRFQMAERVYRAGLDLDPDDVEIHLNLGRIALKMKNAPAARKAFDRVLALDPGNAEALAGLSRAHAMTGKATPEEIPAAGRQKR